MATATPTTANPMAWEELKTLVSETPVGSALDADAELRKKGKGGPSVHNKLRLFADDEQEQPAYTLYRDHAGWCPYCQKTMLLIEAKEIPIQIELVNMRSYGDKSPSFLRKVPNGMLPALEDNQSGRVALDSAYIMEFLEDFDNSNTNGKSKSKNISNMIPYREGQPQDYARYQKLMGLERELFRWWCTFMFRPEQPGSGRSGGNPVAGLVGNLFGNSQGNDSSNGDDDSYVSPSMGGFLQCLETVDDQLGATNGPYFLDYTDQHPTMVDFVYASHVERMLASCAYWKGMNLRSPTDYPKLGNLQRWMDSLEQQEYYLAFKSDYYTHVKDIPPQYGPSSTGVSRSAKIKDYQANIEGTKTASSSSWTLPLEDDDSLQSLFKGIPLPLCVLEAAGISPDSGGGSYEQAKTSPDFQTACQTMAGWKLCGNGSAVAKFAARGGPNGAKNFPRKTFGAELADPYAAPDSDLVDTVDATLRVVARAMLECEANSIPDEQHVRALQAVAGNSNDSKGVRSSLAYLRDRIGVPRDLPLASARYLRAYLNWAIDVLE
eukprot:CAMPEP_0168184598 /NCGR_PEP_ID=MMETSP0139_2-20121125/13334_1 /TAXON_ID=44445 /ORGANISM="Pseudo-nitzschia australis, Strain 10249 10 AB" /LENGTH=548 /DNA_ID=CAMNT_0008106249 /DNA_START=384 /DNA_END=2030 /DNA_ORIENTATION=+